MATSDELYDEILASGPSSETLFLVLSRMKEAGQRKRVIQECIKAISSRPSDIPLRRLLSETYFEEGLLAKAEEELGRLLSQTDELAGVYKLQAVVYQRQKRYPEAIKTLKVYLAHRPDDREAIDLLESLAPPLDVSEIPSITEEASEPIGVVVEMVPEPIHEMEEEKAAIEKEDFPEIATPTLAEVYVNQGQILEALHIYEKIIEDHPEDDASRQRILELKAMMAPPPAPEIKDDQEKRKKEKMIATLNAWLEEIRKGAI